MSPDPDGCDDCLPPELRRRLGSYAGSTIAASALPFLLTFLVISTVAQRKLFPLLSGDDTHPQSGRDERLPFSTADVQHRRPASPSPVTGAARAAKRVASLTFATTIALAAVLAELLLCEISNALNPAVRAAALSLTVSALLALLLVATPLLEIHSLVTAAGWHLSDPARRTRRTAWILEGLGFAGWLGGFWWIGRGVPGNGNGNGSGAGAGAGAGSLSEACLERIGVVGIALMALLSGFASVSSPWQNFGPGRNARPVTPGAVARKQAGLEASEDMLRTKRSRLRALERKMATATAENASSGAGAGARGGATVGFVSRVVGSGVGLFRGDADTTERRALELEISGLETMTLTLSGSLAMLRSRLRTQQRAATPGGRVLLTASYLFSLYCVYRILTTSLAALRRSWLPSSSSSSSSLSTTDPITNLLALLAKHWDPSLDRAAWARQISFLLSGIILCAAFTSVLQTTYFLSRLAPRLVRAAHANLALLVGQICATYVVAAALLLQSNLPADVVGGGNVSDALGAGRAFEGGWVERWFEAWFLGSCALSIIGIWVGRKVIGLGGEWDDEGWDEGGDPGTGKWN